MIAAIFVIVPPVESGRPRAATVFLIQECCRGNRRVEGPNMNSLPLPGSGYLGIIVIFAPFKGEVVLGG